MAVENPDDPNLRPASFLQDSVLLTAKDPSASVPGMPINYGRYPLVHSASFQAYMSTGTGKVYREYDEAVKASLDNARYMRNDCGIMECLEARQRMVSLLDWHLEPEDEKDAQQKEWCAKLTAMIQRIHRFTEYRRCLMEAIWYGKHGVQNRYGWVNIGGCQYQIPKPRHKDDLGWRPINGDKLVFRQDRLDLPEEAYAGQLGIRVGNNWQLGQMVANTWKIEQVDRGMAYFLRPWERDLLCVHRHMIEDAAYEDALDAGTINGVGIRSRIYWEWVQKQESLGFLMDYLERSAGGIELWSYPQGNAQAKAEVETAAKNRARGQNVMLVPIPMGEDSGQYGVNIIEPGMQGIETVHNLVSDYYGHRIKRYILGQTLSSEADATGMGSGVADLHLDTLMQIIKYDARGLEETLTYQLVDMLQRLNLPESVGTMIRFKLDVESPDVEKKLEAYARAYEMGARIGERDVLNLIGASVPGPDDRVLMKPEQQQPGGDGMGGMGGGAMGDGSGASDDRLAGQLQQEFHHQQEQMQAAGGAGSGVRSGGSGDTDGDGDTDSDDGGSGKKQPGGGGKGGPLKYSRDWSETEHPRDPDNGQFVGDDDDEKNEDSDDSGEGSSGDEKPAISRRGNMDFEDAKIALLAHPDGQILFQSAIKNGEIAGKMAGDEQRQSLTRIVNLMLSKLDKKTKLAYRSVMRHFEGHRLDDQIADEDPELFDELQADGTDKYARDEGKSRWITLNGGHGEGTHVLVDSAGNIKGGPDSLTGKNLDNLSDSDKGHRDRFNILKTHAAKNFRDLKGTPEAINKVKAEFAALKKHFGVDKPKSVPDQAKAAGLKTWAQIQKRGMGPMVRNLDAMHAAASDALATVATRMSPAVRKFLADHFVERALQQTARAGNGELGLKTAINHIGQMSTQPDGSTMDDSVRQQWQIAANALREHLPQILAAARGNQAVSYARVGWRDLYARARKADPKQKSLQWITIGGGEEGDKKHVGGTPVQIDGSGNIHSGPDALRGKNLDNLDGDKQGEGSGGGEEKKDSGKPAAAETTAEKESAEKTTNPLTAAMDAEFALARQSAAGRKKLEIENNDANKQGALFIGKDDKPGQNYLFGNVQSSRETAGNDLEGGGEAEQSAEHSVPAAEEKPAETAAADSSLPQEPPQTPDAPAATPEPPEPPRMIHGREIRGDGKPKSFSRHLGNGKREKVLPNVPKVGDVFQGKDGPYVITKVGRLDLLTRDMLDDQDNFDTKTGWHSNYEAVPVQPSKEESAAKDKETRQKSSHDAIKQIERDLWGLETSESGPSGDISHLVDFGRQPMGGSKGQIGIRGDSAYYYHPGSYDDYRPVFKVSSDPEMVASVKSAIEDAFSSHGHSSPAGLSFSGSAIPEKPKPQPKPEPKPELPPKRETAATPAEKKPEPVPAAPKTDSLVSRKVADGDPVRAGGKTFNNKDELKSLGARWDGQNKEWVFHVADMSQSQRDALERKMDRLKSRGVTFYSRGKSLFAIDSQDEQQKFSRRLTSLMDDAITRYYRSDSDGSISHPDDHGVTFAEAPAHSPASHPPAKNKPGWQHVGGSSVFVNADGKITKGCPGLKGEHVSDLIDESDESRDERDARQAHAKARGLTGKDLTGTEAKRLGTKKLQAQHQAAKQAAKSSGIGTHHVLRNLPEAQQRLAATGDQFEPARARARQLTGHNTRTLGAVENRGGGDANSVANLDTIGQQLAEEFPELGWDVNDSNGDKVFDLIRQGKSADRFAPHSPEVAAHAAELARQDKAAARQTQKPQPQRAPLADPIAETMQQMFDSYSSGDDWQQGAGDEPYEPEDEWSMGEQFQQRQRQNQRQEADAVPF